MPCSDRVGTVGVSGGGRRVTWPRREASSDWSGPTGKKGGESCVERKGLTRFCGVLRKEKSDYELFGASHTKYEVCKCFIFLLSF